MRRGPGLGGGVVLASLRMRNLAIAQANFLGNIFYYMHSNLATHQTKMLEMNCVIVLAVMTVMCNDSAVVGSGRLLLSCHHSLKHQSAMPSALRRLLQCYLNLETRWEKQQKNRTVEMQKSSNGELRPPKPHVKKFCPFAKVPFLSTCLEMQHQ